MRDLYHIERKSPFTGIYHEMPIRLDYNDYMKWKNGALIQNAMPYLTPEEREFLMTGITPEDWDSMGEYVE